MKTLIAVLIISAFVQTAVIPVNLILLILIARSYLKAESSNLYLAFAFGFLTAHLNLSSLGLTALSYLIFVSGVSALSKLRMAGNPLAVIPVSFLILSADKIITMYLQSGIFLRFSSSWFTELIFASVLSLPVLYAVRLWEERFIAHKDIKLKI